MKERSVGGGEGSSSLLSISRFHNYYSFATALSFVIAQPQRRHFRACEFLQAMTSVSTEYISVGGNRHPGAADWDVHCGVLAYGADNNVALWEPLVGPMRFNNFLVQLSWG